MKKTIELPADLYERLGQYAKAFETPAQVIERLLDLVEEREDSGGVEPQQRSPEAITPVQAATRSSKALLYSGKLQVNFVPSDPALFKAQLLKRKEAWVLMHFRDGRSDLKHWVAGNFKPSSDVMANLRSGYLRGWREKGIVRADVSIDPNDLDVEEGLV